MGHMGQAYSEFSQRSQVGTELGKRRGQARLPLGCIGAKNVKLFLREP